MSRNRLAPITASPLTTPRYSLTRPGSGGTVERKNLGSLLLENQPMAGSLYGC